MDSLPRSPLGFPMAPSQDEWDRMTPRRRRAVVAALPDEVTEAEMSPPEGDWHFGAKIDALSTLRSYFRSRRRSVYLASELPVYYPREPRFAPDLLAVLDVEQKKRGKWVVPNEKRGLDWVMEVHHGGDRKKDAETNVARYARLGIPEYFIYDVGRQRLTAYRLGSARARKYTALMPQLGRYRSEVLDLDLQVEGEHLRFYAGTSLLLETSEFVERLQAMLREAELRVEEEARLRQDEARLRQEAEREVARLRDELKRAKKD